MHTGFIDRDILSQIHGQLRFIQKSLTKKGAHAPWLFYTC